jgi:3-oxoacyl-[acyl-carrier-protein] synthase II
VNNTVVDGITSGLTALVHAYDLLRNDPGQDAIAVVAADEIGSLFYDVFSRRGWLAKDADGQPPLLRAYGRGNGLVVGEAGAALILERAAIARRRGATPLARIAGVGATADSFAFREMDASATYLSRAIRLAIDEAGTDAAHIDWAIGHGRGVPRNDEREIAAMLDVFGGVLPPVSCVSGNVGVASASSGLLSVAAATLGMQHGEAYPLASIDSSLDTRLPFVQGSVRKGDYQRVLIAGSTEHGNNHAIVLQRV